MPARFVKPYRKSNKSDFLDAEVITSGMDARSCTAIITSKGRLLLRRAGEQWEKVQTRVVERFGRSEWAAFVANIEKLRVCAEGDDTGNR